MHISKIHSYCHLIRRSSTAGTFGSDTRVILTDPIIALTAVPFGEIASLLTRDRR